MKSHLLQCSYVLQPHTHGGPGISAAAMLFTAVAIALYGLAAFILWQNKKGWSPWRAAGFTAGCLLIGFAFSPAMVDGGHHNFKVHMLQHLLLAMLAPIALVLGAPMLLALKVLPPTYARLLSQVLSSPFFHFLSHPITALALNVGGMYALYLTPLYNHLHNSAALHWLVHFHFLAAGYLFTWAIIGPDPAPRRPKLLTRLVVLFISIAAHAYLSKFMYAYVYPRNSIHSDAEIQAAAKLMYYGGDLAELLLVMVLFTIWYNKKGKPYYQLAVEVKQKV